MRHLLSLLALLVMTGCASTGNELEVAKDISRPREENLACMKPCS